MSNSNKPEGRQVKKCPFINDWCIGDECAIHSYIALSTPTGMQRKLVCSIEAILIIISEMNRKTPQQHLEQPQIILPFMGRG